jgi:hypothetical protein
MITGTEEAQRPHTHPQRERERERERKKGEKICPNVTVLTQISYKVVESNRGLCHEKPQVMPLAEPTCHSHKECLLLTSHCYRITESVNL